MPKRPEPDVSAVMLFAFLALAFGVFGGGVLAAWYDGRFPQQQEQAP